MKRSMQCAIALVFLMSLFPATASAQNLQKTNDNRVPGAYASAVAVDSGLAAAIQNALYEVRPARGGYEANNASQHLYAQFTPGTVKITSGANTLQLRLLGRSSAVETTANGPRLERRYDGMREWFVNSPAGIEQGFVLEHPAGQQPTIRVAVEGGWQTKVEDQMLTLAKGESKLQYSALKAWDARGTPLAAQMQVADGGFAIRVDDANAVYPVTIDPVLAQQTTLTVSGITDFGYSVTLSGDGNTALIGAPETAINGNANQGAAFIFTRTAGVWTQQVQLMPPTTGDAVAGPNEQFGFSVSLSNDGETAVVSAFGQTVGNNAYAGGVFVYKFDGTSWNQTAFLSQDIYFEGFGQYARVSGDGSTVFVHGGIDATAYIYGPIPTSIGYILGFQASLAPPENSPQGPNFGDAAALSYDGSTALVNGLVYTRSGTAWSFQQEIGSGGYPIALSDSGTTALLGNIPNSVAVYTNQGGVWTEQAVLSNPSPAYVNGNLVSNFGWSLSLSRDGTKALIGDIGAPGTGGNPQAGAAALFAYNGSSWSLAQYISDPVGATYDFFGDSVGLNSDGTTALVGSDGASTVYVYYGVNVTINSTPSGLQFTSSGDAGCAPGTYTTPATLALTPADTCIFTFATPQPGPPGTQYVFASWENASTNPSRQIVVPSANTTYTATFGTQYQLTTLALPANEGSITPSTGYFNAGSAITVTATSNPGDVFTGFSGGLTGTTDPQTITMNAPYTVSASFETVLQAVEATVTRLIENSSLPPAIKQLILNILGQLPTVPGTLTAAQRSAAITNLETLATDVRLLFGSQASQTTNMINQAITSMQ